MRHIIFEEADRYRVALLIKGAAFNKQALTTAYVTPLASRGIAAHEQIAFTLAYNDTGKAPAKFIKDYLEQLLPVLDSLAITHLYVADAHYFKVLAGQVKAEPHAGYVLPCKLKGYEHFNIVLGVNHQALIFNPELQAKLDLSLDALASHLQGTYQAPGVGILHSAAYPQSLQEIDHALESLHQYPSLACDIEAFSLRFNEAGIGTIAFAWDQHHGVAFACDYAPCHYTELPGIYGEFLPNKAVRQLLLQFFCSYQGELTFHNATYDVKVLIYYLWMADLLDTKGLLAGLDCLTARLHDTKVIAYLATNSTAGNVLGLKALAHEFAGNWAKDDIKDIRKIPLPELLQYNLVDALSTHYVRNKYEPLMVRDQQAELYRSLMLPSLKMLIQVELTGLPMSKAKIAAVKARLETLRNTHLATITGSAVVKTMNLLVQTGAMEAANAKLKTKQHPLSKFAGEVFNPNSGPQLQRLLYTLMGLPVLDVTDTKQPATGADTIEKLIHHTQEPAYQELLAALIGYGEASKILNTFIPAFERAIEKGSGDTVWLHGSFNLGGTVSGRLSSSDPNQTNIPAGSVFGKLIKECFVSPQGWVFAGADFASLEDYISALTTKDPNKLRVYLRGFDGHCLRAAYYYRDQLLHIDLDDPKSVNTLKKTHPELRQDSKPATFLLTYGGTYHGMMANLGWGLDKSKAIEANYHALYKVSDEYVAARLQQASQDGYVEVAFGLRVRTPLLKQVIFKGKKMPYEAAAEGRTAGNALGQSYCMLTMRAMVDFMQKVWASKYRHDILPAALIHDANYVLVRDDLEVVEWANRELIASMQWQELPEIQHDSVKLGAALDLFWPDWAHPITLPNNADAATIRALCQQAQGKLQQAA